MWEKTFYNYRVMRVYDKKRNIIAVILKKKKKNKYLFLAL